MIKFDENLEPQKILKLLSYSMPYYIKSWTDYENNTGLFGNINPKSFNMNDIKYSSPVIEYVIRPHLNILAILAIYIKNNRFEIDSSVVTTENAISYVNKGIKWVCETHLTGSMDVDTFLDRKRWGENWRSGLWTGILAITTFFIGSKLDNDLKEKVHKIIAFEADRFIDILPPSGCEIDTKLNENAQDAMLLSWAINMLPNHPNKTKWEEALCLWSMNVATKTDDKYDHTRFLGKSVSKWTTTQTLFPDNTTENHGFFHPETLSYSMWIVMAISAFELHNNQVPAYLKRKNHQETFDVLLKFFLPNGMIHSPANNDLPMFIPRPLMLSWGLWNNDKRALNFTSKLLTWMNSIIETISTNKVPWVLGFKPHYEGWELVFQSQVGFELAMLAELPLQKNPVFFSSTQIENTLDSLAIYKYVEVCHKRNIRLSRSIAWKTIDQHPTVGLSIHSAPELLVPHRASFLGIPQTSDSITRWQTVFHEDRKRGNGFDSFGQIEYYDNLNELAITRNIRVITWGEDSLLIFDKIIAQKELLLKDSYMSTAYFVNDNWTQNQLKLTSGSLHETISSDSNNKKILSCPSFWVSVNSTFLFQFVWGRSKGLIYIPGNKKNAPNYWRNCRLDMLAVHLDEKQYNNGDIVYEVGYYVGVGKSPKPFKSTGTSGEFFKGLVVMDGKNTIGLS